MAGKQTLKVHCPLCNVSLMDGSQLVDGEPGVHVMVKTDRKPFSLWLSSIYGSYEIRSEKNIKENTVARFYCPHCKKELKAKRKCTECASPVISFSLDKGGMVNICSRKGCKKHSVEFESINDAMSYFNDLYGYDHAM